jgi:tetratricopeptide (TPR) repeat protein
MRVLKVCFALGCLMLWSRRSFAGEAQWVEIQSPNFSVLTDAGDKRGRDVALHFEQMRSVFGTLMTKAHVSLAVPLQIVAFRSSKEIRQMSPVFNGKPTEDAGMFQPGDDRCFIMLDMSVDDPWAVVFHEYAHQLMNANMSTHTDPWFEEGFAEYFASIEAGNKEVHVGKIPEDTYRILQHEGMMRVADLFRVQQNSKTYNESGSHRNSFYAESSLVVHYLYDNHLIPKLADYFAARIEDKKTVEEATRLAFGMTPEQFDKVLRDYLNSGHFKYYPISTPSGIVAAQFTETPVSLNDAHAVLADIDVHSLDHHDRALSEFEEVLKVDPNNAAALRGMGFAYLQRQDYEHAGEYFRRAAERDTKDPRVHYYNALLMNREGPGAGGGAKTEELKKELEIAIALDPKFADAYSLLGWAEAASGDREKGLATMKKAVELSPRNESYQINLANLYLANRKVDEAIVLFQRLASSGDPTIAASARAALAQAESVREWSKSEWSKSRASQAEVKPGNVVLPVIVRPHDSESVPEGHVERKIDGQSSSQPAPSAAAPPPPVHFVKGKLAAIDCSAAPQALLKVMSGGRLLKLHVGDTNHLVLLGSDNFSCDWKNRAVAVNYRDRQDKDGDGDVVSLEMQ